MDTQNIIKLIDAEIIKLQQVRNLLSTKPTALLPAAVPKKRGRPKGSTNSTTNSATAKTTAKRGMSPEARARIAAAQKARWAKAKKTPTK